ncbi:hypothetical protein Tsubulata_033005 [Turnera subulata]|uniref:Uncharacterized protein n=1 Tax=Turnera subulata TaxID=218843 RepID=A0A9Q0FRJ2_9ROSI|nr:hypothetical protein Tsubulata_033005 [Turnera subulata]
MPPPPCLAICKSAGLVFFPRRLALAATDGCNHPPSARDCHPTKQPPHAELQIVASTSFVSRRPRPSPPEPLSRPSPSRGCMEGSGVVALRDFCVDDEPGTGVLERFCFVNSTWVLTVLGSAMNSSRIGAVNSNL